MNPYEILGVPHDASPDAIKAAYRTRAKTLHPDGGGDADAFQRLGIAHRILSDGERRRKYDATGETDDRADRSRASALQMIHNALGGFMGDDNAIYRDLVAETRTSISGELRVMTDKIAAVRSNVRRAEGFRKRFKAKTGPDFIGQMIEAQIVGANQMIEQIEEQVKIAKLALEILADAEFQVEPRPVYAQQRNVFGSTGLGGVFGQTTGGLGR